MELKGYYYRSSSKMQLDDYSKRCRVLSVWRVVSLQLRFDSLPLI